MHSSDKSTAERPGNQAGEERFISFKLADEVFAVPILRVLGVRPAGSVNPSQDIPDFLHGTIEVSEAIVPALDLRAHFSLPALDDNFPRSSDSPVALIVAVEHSDITYPVALVVDALLAIPAFAPARITRPPSLSEEYGISFVLGMVEQEDGLVTVLDIDHLLTAEQLEQM